LINRAKPTNNTINLTLPEGFAIVIIPKATIRTSNPMLIRRDRLLYFELIPL
jgi:hypothetical protein